MRKMQLDEATKILACRNQSRRKNKPLLQPVVVSLTGAPHTEVSLERILFPVAV